MKARVFLLLALLLAAGTSLWWWYPRGDGPDVWQGYVDANFVRIGPPLLGRLTGVPVQAGEMVKTGQLLFTQDDVNDLASRDEIAARVKEAEARLTNLQASARQEEIAQAEATVADNKATLERTTVDFARAETLVRTQSVSVQQRDQIRAEMLSAAAKVRVAEAALALKKAPAGRPGEIAAQAAVLAEDKAQLAQAEWRLAQRRMVAPADALIADVYARPGETPNAGVPVVSLLPPENLLIRFFVSETVVAGLHPGDRLAIACDSCQTGLTAVISFVSARAEYTPPVIYSEATRGKLVIMIEARPTPPDIAQLKPGQPVTLRSIR